MERKKKNLIRYITVVVCVLISLSFALEGCSAKRAVTNGSDETEGLNTEEKERLNAIKKAFMEQSITFEKQVLLENTEVRVTATDLTISDGKLELAVLYENYSNQRLYFNTQIISVNQYAVESIGGDSGVDGNDKVEDSTWLKDIDSWDQDESYTLLPLGIRNVSEIEVKYTVKTGNSLFGGTIYQGTQTFRVSEANTDSAKNNCFLTGLEDGSYSLLTNKKVEHIASDISCQLGNLNVVLAAVMRQDNNYFLCVQTQNAGDSSADYEISDIAVNGLVLQNHPNTSPRDLRSVSAGKYAVSTIDITPLETVKDCFQLDEIGSVSFTIESNREKQKISFDIPGKKSTFNEAGPSIYTKNGVQIIFTGFHQSNRTFVDYAHGDYVTTTEPVYEMVIFVKNTLSEKVDIELDPDALFFNYKKVQFAEYQTLVGTTNYLNFGYIPGGYSGYIIFELDSDSIESNHFNDLSVVTDIEMKMTIECWDLYHDDDFEDTETLRFTLQ